MKFDKKYKTKDTYAIYNWMLEDCGCNLLPDVPYEKRKLPYEDVFPMLYLKYRLSGGNSTHKNIKHLVIDEMQDYSYLQYYILKQLFSCNMTILGDRAQTMDDREQDVLTFLPGIFGKQVKKIVMNKSYRNTMEIAAYAGAITGIQDLELFERHGKEVTEAVFERKEDALDALEQELRLAEDAFETAAVLTFTEEEAKAVYEELKHRGREAAYIDRDSSTFRKGLTVTTFYLAKGLEFCPGREDALAKQARYICATRALHELYMYEIK